MPNLRLEYTDNVQIDTQSLFHEFHRVLTDTGYITLKGLRSQATCLTDYLIADGHESYQHIMVTLTICSGRPFEARAEFARRIMAVLEANFGQMRETSGLSLMVDVQEMSDGILHIHHNIPAGGWVSEGHDSVEFICPVPTPEIARQPLPA